MRTSPSESFERERTAHSWRPSRSTPTAIRTSSASGWAASARARAASSPAGVAARTSASASGGTRIRSTTRAAPSTPRGQASWASRSSRSETSGTPSCSTEVRWSGSARASSTTLAGSRHSRSGSRARASAVRTRANSRRGAPQPSAATWRSISATVRHRPEGPGTEDGEVCASELTARMVARRTR
ncbi:hypothetical protein Krad_1192 [Kineococcus radiotolerans SRS30216 = ATCC BAA-149]|uniref:Uncharacterized protein n=1 Tax=Kineococcus radiotolerans (strain ATCC BAA-149 / DSM 14245 / SRS30216) TaxID=266940 RepID=A6W791_KINRD|nr:hypothetical protein Krad_1192 [Kineococcus radiotolerans SRS30216 = ATCC BAA-149]